MVPTYSVGMVVTDSGSVDQKPRFRRFVVSAMKICCVIAKAVEATESKIPDTCG
jgi:hypothetical protein